MARQTGCIYKSDNGERWFARWRETVIEHGKEKRKLRFRDLAPVCDRYRTERDVQGLLDDILQPINAGTAKPESTLTVADYANEFWLPWTKENCKDSSAYGYERFWRYYLEPRLRNVQLRDFRTFDAANLLADLHRSTGCGRTMLKHAKSILSGIFKLAKNLGALDGVNPIKDAMIPRKASPPPKKHAHTLTEVVTILDAVARQEVKDQTITREMRLRAQAAIALQFFAGLRPGEARGVCWEDFDGKRLNVRQSVWRTKISTPKTEDSVRIVPVIEPLMSILADLREADGNPASGPILRGSRDGKPLILDNLERRVVSPLLKAAGIAWFEWYAFRRGAGTTITSISGDSGLAAKGLLGHSNLSTTQAHYVKDCPEDTRLAMERLELLFNDCSTGTKQ